MLYILLQNKNKANDYMFFFPLSSDISSWYINLHQNLNAGKKMGNCSEPLYIVLYITNPILK